MKYLVIANPVAGSGEAKKTLKLLVSALKKRNIFYEIRVTESKGHAARLASDGLRREFTHFISLGGDGTSSEIVSSLRGSEAIAGIIPCGSGNDFPKAAGIPINACDAVENIFSGIPREVDVAFIDDRCFINGFGTGMDGAVAYAFSRGLKYLGSFGYVVGAIIEAFRFRGFFTNINTVLGERFQEKKLLLFGASNGSFQGGKFRLAPNASVFDGFLDIHVIDDMKSLQRLLRIPKVLEGKHEGMDGVKILKIKKLEFETLVDLPAHIDGETFTLCAGKHEIVVGERGIRIIVSRGDESR